MHQTMNGDQQSERGGAELVRAELESSSASSNLAFNEKVKALQAEGSKIFHFGFGQSPFPVPDCLTRALQQHAHRHENLSMQGLPSLRKSLADLHHREDGLTLDPNAMIVGPGSKELIYLTMAVSTGVVIVPSPAWTTYAPQVRLAGLRLHVPPTAPGAEGGHKITPALLKDALSSHPNENNIFLILTNPGNPSGTCYTDSELKELSSICRSRAVVVLSDEIYARLKFEGQHASMMKHYPERSVLFSGISKWASAGGWRLSYAHYPPTLAGLRSAVTAVASQTYSCAPAPVQWALGTALEENYEELMEYSRDCSKILQAVAKYCYTELRAAGLSGTRSSAGYYFMPDFEPLRTAMKKRGIATGEQLSRALLEEAGVAVMASSHFLMPEDDLSTRFCFVCFDGAAALEALQLAKGRALRPIRQTAGLAQAARPGQESNGAGEGRVGEGPVDGVVKVDQKNNGPEKAFNDVDVSEEFVLEYCKPVVDGVQAIKEWIHKL